MIEQGASSSMNESVPMDVSQAQKTPVENNIEMFDELIRCLTEKIDSYDKFIKLFARKRSLCISLMESEEKFQNKSQPSFKSYLDKGISSSDPLITYLINVIDHWNLSIEIFKTGRESLSLLPQMRKNDTSNAANPAPSECASLLDESCSSSANLKRLENNVRCWSSTYLLNKRQNLCIELVGIESEAYLLYRKFLAENNLPPGLAIEEKSCNALISVGVLMKEVANESQHLAKEVANAPPYHLTERGKKNIYYIKSISYKIKGENENDTIFYLCGATFSIPLVMRRVNVYVTRIDNCNESNIHHFNREKVANYLCGSKWIVEIPIPVYTKGWLTEWRFEFFFNEPEKKEVHIVSSVWLVRSRESSSRLINKISKVKRPGLRRTSKFRRNKPGVVVVDKRRRSEGSPSRRIGKNRGSAGK